MTLFKPKPRHRYDSNGCRWERSKWPHPKYPKDMRDGCLPDTIWLRFHLVFRGAMFEEVTGWTSDKNKDLCLKN